jgi:glutamate 5-kinase
MDRSIDNILVVKVGTSTLTKTLTNGQVSLDYDSFCRLGKQIIELKQSGYHIVIVSSAAITAGMGATGLTVRPDAKKRHA